MKLTQDAQGIYEIYPLLYKPFWQTQWFFYSCFFIAGMTLVMIGLYSYKRFVKFHLYRSIPLTDTVMESLRTMRTQRQSGLYSNKNVKEFYQDLGLVLRNFFTDVHFKNMLTQTEFELVEHVEACALCKSFLCEHCSQCTKSKHEKNGLVTRGRHVFLSPSNTHEHAQLKELIRRMYQIKYDQHHDIDAYVNKDFQTIVSMITQTYNRTL